MEDEDCFTQLFESLKKDSGEPKNLECVYHNLFGENQLKLFAS